MRNDPSFLCEHNDPSYYLNVVWLICVTDVLTRYTFFISQETKLSEVCERVLDRCLAPSLAVGDGCDNMTMILVQFKKPLQTSAPAQEQSSSNEQDASEPTLENS